MSYPPQDGPRGGQPYGPQGQSGQQWQPGQYGQPGQQQFYPQQQYPYQRGPYQQPGQPPSGPPRGPRTGLIIGIVVGAVLLVALAGMAMVLATRGSDPEPTSASAPTEPAEPPTPAASTPTQPTQPTVPQATRPRPPSQPPDKGDPAAIRAVRALGQKYADAINTENQAAATALTCGKDTPGLGYSLSAGRDKDVRVGQVTVNSPTSAQINLMTDPNSPVALGVVVFNRQNRWCVLI